MMVLGQYRAVMADIWWHWGGTGWYLVILGQYNLVLFGIKWYWANKGLLCLYILKKLMVTSTNRQTNRVNPIQSWHSGLGTGVRIILISIFGEGLCRRVLR